MSWGDAQRVPSSAAGVQWGSEQDTTTPPSRWHPQATAIAQATATVVIDAAALAGVGPAALAVVPATGEAIAAVGAGAEATWPAELPVARAGVGADAPAELEPDATGDASVSHDPGFPYTFPFIFGGPVVVSAYAMARARVVIDCTAPARIGSYADAVVSIVGVGEPGGGFPFTFPYTFPG